MDFNQLGKLFCIEFSSGNSNDEMALEDFDSCNICSLELQGILPIIDRTNVYSTAGCPECSPSVCRFVTSSNLPMNEFSQPLLL